MNQYYLLLKLDLTKNNVALVFPYAWQVIIFLRQVQKSLEDRAKFEVTGMAVLVQKLKNRYWLQVACVFLDYCKYMHLHRAT
jgi:hypothetical protein